jgi:RNA polymerase sigma factor (sigma-70 family)
MPVQNPPEGPESGGIDESLRNLCGGSSNSDINIIQVQDELVEIVYEPLLSFIHNQLRLMRVQDLDEKEVFNETLVRFVEHLLQHPLDPDRMPNFAWFRTVARNIIIDRLRLFKREQELSIEDNDVRASVNQPAEDLSWIIKRTVDDVLETTLSGKCRDIALMYYSEGLRQEQIAAKIGLSRQRVGQYLELALKQLRGNKQLQELIRKKGQAEGVTVDAK